ncbi:MAG: DUF1800 domain-containing protein [Sphingomonas sp.]|nr:DUF1800 domain-containing protein [Sphingomonas sp.]
MGRFGLGPRGDEEANGDAREWLAAQLDWFEPTVPGTPPTRRQVADKIASFYATLERLRRERESGTGMDDPEQVVRRQARQNMLTDGMALIESRTASALTTQTPFIERMVHFWSNHFATSARKVGVFGMAGVMEFDAIRPNVLGRFEDLLLAAEQHPAMLIYLDQSFSLGPNSRFARFARRRGQERGLNENLAREILELHTLGVRSGYSQDDVTELARALTGWTVAGLLRGPLQRFSQDEPGDFTFIAGMHEPGTRTLLGNGYASDGREQGEAMLKMLARHPATARHIATKLARHFAADDPPASMVARLERAFLDSNGHLPTVYRAIIDSPEAWNTETPKFRDPWDWTIASLRAVGAREIEGRVMFGALNELAQPVWQPPSPAGWDDKAAAWAAPDALVRRVEVAQRVADLAARGVDARQLAPAILGERLSENSAQAIRRAESPATGLALFLASPEMLRR